MVHNPGLKVNLNNSSLDEIASIPHVGRDKAERIISNRPYKSWDDLKKVPGISKGMLDELKSNVTL